MFFVEHSKRNPAQQPSHQLTALRIEVHLISSSSTPFLSNGVERGEGVIS